MSLLAVYFDILRFAMLRVCSSQLAYRGSPSLCMRVLGDLCKTNMLPMGAASPVYCITQFTAAVKFWLARSFMFLEISSWNFLISVVSFSLAPSLALESGHKPR